MEALRDESSDEGDSLGETSKDVGIVSTRKGSNSEVELETPEVWLDHQGEIKKGTNGKWLSWLKIIGKGCYPKKGTQIWECFLSKHPSPFVFYLDFVPFFKKFHCVNSAMHLIQLIGIWE